MSAAATSPVPAREEHTSAKAADLAPAVGAATSESATTDHDSEQPEPSRRLDAAAAALVRRLSTQPFARLCETEQALRNTVLEYHHAFYLANRRRISATQAESNNRYAGRQTSRPARLGTSTPHSTELKDSEFNAKIRVGTEYQAECACWSGAPQTTDLTERERDLSGSQLGESESLHVERRGWAANELETMEMTLHNGEARDFFEASRRSWDGVATSDIVSYYYHYWKQTPNVVKECTWPPARERKRAKSRR